MEKDHIQFIQGTWLDTSVKLRHIYLSLQYKSHVLFNIIKMHSLLHSVLLPRSTKNLGYYAYRWTMALSWLVACIFCLCIYYIDFVAIVQ